MKRTLTLGLAAAFALALFSFPASASAAEGFASSAYPASVESSTKATHTFAFGARHVSCSGPALKGGISSTSTEPLSVSVGASTCSYSGQSGPLQMNGCQFELEPETDTYDIGPSGCGPIKMAIPGCEITIGSQTLDAGYANTGSGSGAKVLFDSEETGMSYTRSGAVCGWGTNSNGSYFAQWTLAAVNEIGQPAGLRVEDLANGLEVVGEESGTPALQPRFEAESYPARFRGEQTKPEGWKFKGAAEFQCKSLTLWGSAVQSSTSLQSGMLSEGCTGFYGSNLTVDMNSCWFEIGAANAGPPYVGTLGVDCQSPGDAIEASFFACTLKFPAQAGQPGVEFTNSGAGSNRTVASEFDVEGLQHVVVRHNLLCPALAGSHSNGTLSGSLTWRGMKW